MFFKQGKQRKNSDREKKKGQRAVLKAVVKHCLGFPPLLDQPSPPPLEFLSISAVRPDPSTQLWLFSHLTPLTEVLSSVVSGFNHHPCAFTSPEGSLLNSKSVDSTAS